MPAAKTTSGLIAYRLLTLPLRRVLQLRLQRQGRMPVTGLFLHRVADEDANDWTLSTSAFDQMLDWLPTEVDLVSFDEAQHLLRHGNYGRMAVHLSFDDGYADNCLHALPTLLQRKIPFCYFVTTSHVQYGKPFPHDLKLGRPLQPNSVEQIKALFDAGVEIGAHTRNHADLGQADPEELVAEIVGSQNDLASWTGVLPRYFAFPYGLPENMSATAVQVLRRQEFLGYCSASGGYQSVPSDAFHLPRFHADANLERIKNWLTLDPRWWWLKPPFDVEQAAMLDEKALSSSDTIHVSA